MKKEQEKGRRNFLRNLISGSAVLLVPGLIKAKDSGTETVKMLTPDGKMVEVKKSAIEKNSENQVASNKEVMDWMNTKSTKA